jgi:hypothetical protein
MRPVDFSEESEEDTYEHSRGISHDYEVLGGMTEMVDWYSSVFYSSGLQKTSETGNHHKSVRNNSTESCKKRTGRQVSSSDHGTNTITAHLAIGLGGRVCTSAVLLDSDMLKINLLAIQFISFIFRLLLLPSA